MKKTILLAACWLFMAAAHAVVPEPGLWAIDTENNGQPGRGFELDIQGSTLVLTFYGYNPDGSAQWYLAAGTLDGENFSGTLEKYAGGMAFGMAQTAAHGVGSAGSVAMHFADSRHGTITLPGEAAKAMSRLNFARPNPPDSLTGAYRLERMVAYLAAQNATIDSQAGMTATGTLRISGTSLSQAVTVTVDNTPSSAALGGSLTDFGPYARLDTVSGSSMLLQFVKRGDELIVFTAGTWGSEVDYWRRVSANPLAALAHAVAPPAGEAATAAQALAARSPAAPVLDARLQVIDR